MWVGGDGGERFDDSGRVLGGQPFEVARCWAGDDKSPWRVGHAWGLPRSRSGMVSPSRPYRIIYAIDDATRTITVPAIAHRADVHRST
jgi:hypothetical protein